MGGAGAAADLAGGFPGGLRGLLDSAEPPPDRAESAVKAPSRGAQALPTALTLKPMAPFLQHRQASMRTMTVKSPEKDTATTASEGDQESSPSGLLSVGEGW